MPSKLLKPKPMLAIEPCATCGREHADERDYRHCARCGRAFCWMGAPRRATLVGVERRACGSRRDVSSELDPRPRMEYRCRRCVTRSWILFGADWAAMRPLAVYIFLAVAFSLTFWALMYVLVTALLRHWGIG